MTVFLLMSRGTNEPENAWVLSGINVKLALTVSSVSMLVDETSLSLFSSWVFVNAVILRVLYLADIYQNMMRANLISVCSMYLTSFEILSSI